VCIGLAIDRRRSNSDFEALIVEPDDFIPAGPWLEPDIQNQIFIDPFDGGWCGHDCVQE